MCHFFPFTKQHKRLCNQCLSLRLWEMLFRKVSIFKGSIFFSLLRSSFRLIFRKSCCRNLADDLIKTERECSGDSRMYLFSLLSLTPSLQELSAGSTGIRHAIKYCQQQLAERAKSPAFAVFPSWNFCSLGCYWGSRALALQAGCRCLRCYVSDGTIRRFSSWFGKQSLKNVQDWCCRLLACQWRGRSNWSLELLFLLFLEKSFVPYLYLGCPGCLNKKAKLAAQLVILFLN